MRESVEQASLPAIKALSRMPKAAGFLAVLALMAIGIFVKPFGWIAFAIVGLFLVWMLYLGWPRLTQVERLMRFAVIALMVVITIVAANPRS